MEPASPSESDTRATAVSRVIFDAFEDYHARFADITRRAKIRFENSDWNAARMDAV